MNSTTFVLFGKYCPIVDQLGSKDSSRDFQLNCVISYFFLPIFNTPCKRLKIDVIERVKKLGIWMASKQGLDLSNNQISGMLTPELGFLKNLSNIDFHPVRLIVSAMIQYFSLTTKQHQLTYKPQKRSSEQRVQ